MNPLAGVGQHLQDIQSVQEQMPQRIPMPPVRRPVQPAQTQQQQQGGYDVVGTLLHKLIQRTKLPPRAPKAQPVRQMPNPMAQQTGRPSSSFYDTQRNAIQRALMAHFETMQ